MRKVPEHALPVRRDVKVTGRLIHDRHLRSQLNCTGIYDLIFYPNMGGMPTLHSLNECHTLLIAWETHFATVPLPVRIPLTLGTRCC